MSEIPTQVLVQEQPPIDAVSTGGPGESIRLSSLDTSTTTGKRQVTCTQMIPKWLYYLLWTFLGTILLGTPALYIVFKYEPDEFWPVYITTRFVPGLAETFRWSLLAASTYAAYFAVLTLITFVPFVINAADWVFGREVLTTREEDGLVRVMRIKHYFALAVASFALWLMVGLLIGGVSSKSNLLGSSLLSEFYLTRGVFAIMLFFGLLLVEKILVQKVAINYHYDYYADRIKENRFCLAALRRLRRKYPPTHHVSGVMTAKTPEELARDEAVEIAQAIFNGLRRDGRDYLVPSDFEGVLDIVDARRFFDIIDQDSNGDLTLGEMVTGTQNVYTDRDILNQAMVANDELTNRLDALGVGLVTAISATLCLPVFSVSLAASVFYLFSSMMTARMAFSGSLVSIFSTIIFIFVSHPFDVGDVVLINGQKFKVKSIGWWNSSFYGDGQRLVYISNETLDGATIANIRRSGPQVEEVTLPVQVRTTGEQIKALKQRIEEFVVRNPRDYLEGTKVVVTDLVNNGTMRIKVLVLHRSNFQKSDVKNRRSVQLVNFIRDSMRHLNIKWAEQED